MPASLHYAVYGAAEGRRPTPEAPQIAAHPAGATDPVVGVGVNAMFYRNAERFYDSAEPEVSIVILNYGKASLTMSCLDSLWRHTAGYRYEAIVVDNGSHPADFAVLASHPGRFRLYRLQQNRFFGEGNNIGAEVARAPHLLFLNNDTLVTPGWLQPLMGVLHDHDDAGAVGATLVFPDGRLQEAGAMLDRDAVALQRRKGERDDLAPDIAEAVDYCSAAAVLVRREAFEAVLGFDLVWEPAYYEDVDLCLALSRAGWKTYHCSGSRIVHLEHGTTGDRTQDLACDNLVEINRSRFLTRWSAYLANRESVDHVPARAIASETRTTRRGARPRLGLYTPFALIPGGGERYFLSIAQDAASDFDVTLVTDVPYSRLRLLQLGRELGLDLHELQRATVRELAASPPFDVFMAIDTALLPAIPGRGRRNVFVCQFPFPMPPDAVAQRWGNLDTYDRVLVYSEYVRQHTLAALDRLAVPVKPTIEILAPPVAGISGSDTPRAPEILSVGRFYAGGHPKRHDMLVEAFRLIHHERPDARLHLAGALHPEPRHREYLLGLQRQAKDLPITFHLNPARAAIEALYRQSSVYWHATGFGSSPLHQPHEMEHFGIAVVEAMSAGCVPICFAGGGLVDLISPGHTGFTFETMVELRDHTLRVLAHPDSAWVAALRRAAMASSVQYDPAVFTESVRRVLLERQVGEPRPVDVIS